MTKVGKIDLRFGIWDLGFDKIAPFDSAQGDKFA